VNLKVRYSPQALDKLASVLADETAQRASSPKLVGDV
jgi:hypothetical protein